MLFKNFILKFNWRFCLIHFLAIYCIMYAFNTFASIAYTDLVTAYFSKGKEDITSLQDLSNFLITIDIATFVGLLIAFIISLVMATRKKIWWSNSLLIFIIAFSLHRFDFFGWQYVKYIFIYILGWIDNLALYYTICGTLLLSLALLLMFSKTTNRFIASTNKPFISPVP